MGTARQRAAARYASLTRSRSEDDPTLLAAARQDLHAAELEDAINRALASAPPLGAEQRARLAAMLSAGKAVAA